MSRLSPLSLVRLTGTPASTYAATAAVSPARARLNTLVANSTRAGSGSLTSPAYASPGQLRPSPRRPVSLVVLGREVAGAGPGGERGPHRGRVALVAGAPGGGRDVHHVAPALLV